VSYIVHKIRTPFKTIKVGSTDVRTQCGLVGYPDSFDGVYVLVAERGNLFYGSTAKSAVTCQKCINLLTVGTIHDKPSGTANSEEQRAVAHAKRPAARAARAAGRPRRARCSQTF
jgi:hypothetical protein